LEKDWQIGFKVKGLGAPERDLIFNNDILIRGSPNSDSSYVFLKFKVANEEDKDRIRDEAIAIIRNILQVYGLITNVNTELMLNSITTKISSENPFGHTKYAPDFHLKAVIDKSQREKAVPNIEKTLSKYNSIKSVFKNKNKAFLTNAIDYYQRSLGDLRLEEKLIDLMVSLESLFSKNEPELSYRISLRTAFFLGVNQEWRRPEIFKRIHELYGKRSKVIHGIEKIKLEWIELMWLQEQVNEAIKRFIHIRIPQETLAHFKDKELKQRLLGLLDEAIYDESKSKALNTIVKEAVAKW
jgi:hypothetical protein